ncbi:hypothetical protein PIB30_035500 [Stylosanthes scabra]|uniref:Uncharacterized protein n=1 Tax=Stylosanthes scabra TaxID=79078 RepID=A0ABU6YBQ4_9FABA|nr:hypothetical protein [Stylosanthes scabra]
MELLNNHNEASNTGAVGKRTIAWTGKEENAVAATPSKIEGARTKDNRRRDVAARRRRGSMLQIEPEEASTTHGISALTMAMDTEKLGKGRRNSPEEAYGFVF